MGGLTEEPWEKIQEELVNRTSQLEGFLAEVRTEFTIKIDEAKEDTFIHMLAAIRDRLVKIEERLTAVETAVVPEDPET